jgi:hypothetical protein
LHERVGLGEQGGYDKDRMDAKVNRRTGLVAALLALAAALGAAMAPEASAKKPPPPPPPLDGTSYDYAYAASDIGRPERAWSGRVFVHRKAAEAKAQALPLLVFIHGLNIEKIKYRWMGGGKEGDVRRIVAEMIEGGQVPPLLVAGPSTTDPVAAGNAMTSWPAFDLDTFLDRTASQLAGVATIDRARIIVAGHSGAGCNVKGGIATALKAKVEVLAGLVIDTCMGTDLARDLARLRPALNVVVAWQTQSWQARPLDDFRAVFLREVQKAKPSAGVLRELLPERPTAPMPHDAMVELTLKKWLPKLLSPPTAANAPHRP